MRRLRNGLRDGGQWFRMGIVSATVITPLLSRWQSLRAAERARALWEASRTNAQWPWARVGLATEGAVDGSAANMEVDILAPPRVHVRPGLWLAGVGIGLAAAGAVAFVVARRRLLAREAPVDIPWPVSASNGHARSGARSSEQSQLASAAASGSVGVTTSTDPGSGAGDDESLANEPSSEKSIPLAYQSAVRGDDEEGMMSPLVLDAKGAAVIGDTNTRVYRDAGAANLPAPDRRIFFSSAEQAEASGYRPDPTGAAIQPDAGDA